MSLLGGWGEAARCDIAGDIPIRREWGGRPTRAMPLQWNIIPTID